MARALATVAPSQRAARPQGWTARLIAGAVAIVAGVYQGALASLPLNDDFHHFTLARQVLAGDLPGRDFFDSGLTLMYGLSALSQSLLGHRLLAEAVIVGVATAVAAYLVFVLVHRLTGSLVAGFLSALLVIVAGPRGYSYPKVIVYAVAASLWWAYVWAPGVGRAAALGAWAAAAFYWRPDHGAYVAIGTMLAIVTAHGVRPVALARCFQAGAVAVALVLPFIVFMGASVGLPQYVGSGLTMAQAQHATMDKHAWPDWPIRRLDEVIRVDAAEAFAPVITLRWSAGSSRTARQAVMTRYGLTPVSAEEEHAQRVRLSEASLGAIRALLNEPIVEDTAGIDRSSGTLVWETWPVWEQWRFEHPSLRLRLFAGVDEHKRAGEAAAAVLYAMPLAAVVATIGWIRQSAPTGVTWRRLAGFALFGVVTNMGLLRTPYEVRAVEGIVIPAILFGCCVAAMVEAVRVTGGLRRWSFAAITIALILLVTKSVAVAGQFGDRAGWLAGEWRSVERMQGAWAGVRDRLAAEPPLRYWDGRPAPAVIRLAAYARDCVPRSERLLVLWFAPEIYYYADRLMASRHLVFVPGFAAVAHEQRMGLAKLERFSPPLAFANSSLETAVRDIYPAVVDYVSREYDVAGALQEDGERYVVLARRDRRVLRRYGEQQWPCYR